MTDLIKRLREADTYNKKYYAVDPLHQEAADHIKELNELLTAATDDAEKVEAHFRVLEDKLQTASDMLQSFVDLAQHGRFVLRDLEGKDHG